MNLAVTFKREGSACHDPRIVVGATVTTPIRVRAAESFLEGKRLTSSVAGEAADIVAATIEPLADLRGTAEFRRDMVRVVARRTFERLFEGEPAADERHIA